MTGAICISSPPSGGIGSPAPNSPYIPLQGSGAYFLRNSFGGDTYHKKEFAYQFSFLGIEYGNQFAFFTEFGVGYTGTIVAGGRFRF